MAKFVPTLRENEAAQKVRDDYIFKCIERSKEEIKNGGNGKDMISLMLKETDDLGRRIFPSSEILSQGKFIFVYILLDLRFLLFVQKKLGQSLHFSFRWS